MSANERIALGFIGAGNIGNVHMHIFSQIPDVALVGVADVSRPLAEERARQHGIERVYASPDELLADDAIDAVVIGVPNKYHAPLAIKALEEGKHVLLEKPMAHELEAARAIVRAQRAAGTVLMIPHQMRWGWAARQVKEQIEKGALGRIYHAKTGWMRRKGIPGWGTWFTRKSESGGGPLIDIGVHMLDLTLYLMGNPKPVSVFGATYAEFGPRKRGIGTWGKPDWNGIFDVEDLATALIRLEDGSTISLDVSWAVHGEFEGGGGYVHLMGSEGGAALRGDQGTLYAELFDRPVQAALTPPKAVDDPRLLMARHFIECVREGKEPISSAMTGFVNNLVLDGIYRSAQSGTAVTLDWSI